jgi:hypothetical protein
MIDYNKCDQWRAEEDQQAEKQTPNDTTILETAEWLHMGETIEIIRGKLLDRGLNEYQVFLCVKAAEILNKE